MCDTFHSRVWHDSFIFEECDTYEWVTSHPSHLGRVKLSRIRVSHVHKNVTSRNIQLSHITKNATHMSESCQTWGCHVTKDTSESCHEDWYVWYFRWITYRWVMSRRCVCVTSPLTSYVTRVTNSHQKGYEWVMSNWCVWYLLWLNTRLASRRIRESCHDDAYCLSFFYRALLQKRPVILSHTYTWMCMSHTHINTHETV